MFNWFRKKSKENSESVHSTFEVEVQDEIEESLWQIKEEYDLPTEEIVNVVYSKRSNIDIMHQTIRKLNKEKV